MRPDDEDDDRPAFDDAWGEMDESARQRLQQQIEDLAGGMLAANDRLSGGASTQEVWRDLLDPIVPGGVGGDHVSKAEFERIRRVFDKSFRAAALPFRDSGWEIRTRSLRLHGPDGHWGEIWFQPEVMYQRPILVDMYAGVSSPYLMRTISKLDPSVPPPPWRFDVSVLWRQWAIRFDETSDTPPPLDLHLNNISAQFIGQFTETGVELGPSTAGPWMSEALEQLVPAITGLCSDRAMRDWILEHRSEDDTALRLAALLTRHLGLEDELVDILELAERARAESDARAEADGWGDVNVDRRRNYDTLWSHKRFVRFLDEVEL